MIIFLEIMPAILFLLYSAQGHSFEDIRATNMSQLHIQIFGLLLFGLFLVLVQEGEACCGGGPGFISFPTLIDIF